MVPDPRRLPAVLGVVVLAALVVSAVSPYDRRTWLAETFWVTAGLPLVVVTWRRFPLTTLLCCLLAGHALILLAGGHYSHGRVPLGYWLADLLGTERNPYDRIGHLAQGFVPAVLVRELLVRTSPLRGSGWLPPLTVAACLAFSAFFELLEWWATVATGQPATALLGGDPWDAQWDMACALAGALAAVLMLSRVHDRQIARLGAARR